MSTLGERTITIAQTNDGDRLFDALTEGVRHRIRRRAGCIPTRNSIAAIFRASCESSEAGPLSMRGVLQRGYSGAALWLPPEIGPDEAALTLLLEESVPERDRAALFAVFEAMGSYHPNEPHWYLPLIGVEPAQRGKGFGSSLMERALRRCDRDGRPPISNPPVREASHSTSGMDSRFWARFRSSRRRPSFPCSVPR